MTSALPSMGIQTPSIDIISPPKTTTQLTTPQLSKKQQLYHFQNPAKDMSFLRTIAIRAPRAPLAATASTKRVHFSTSPYVQKDSASAVKDTIESVNKTVGDAAAKGIEKGQQATEALKSTVGINAKHAEGSAKKMTGEAKGKGSEMTGQAKGKGSEMTGQAKSKSSEMMGEAKGKGSEMAGKAQEMAGEAKGKAQEVAGQAKGKAEEVKGKM